MRILNMTNTQDKLPKDPPPHISNQPDNPIAYIHNQINNLRVDQYNKLIQQLKGQEDFHQEEESSNMILPHD